MVEPLSHGRRVLDQERNVYFQHPKIVPEKEVRLLEVRNSSRGLIECNFHVQQKSSLARLKYNALSYRWGADPKGDEDLYFISIHDDRFCVRQTVSDFLLAWTFDPGRPATGYNLIFIDAICINQLDDHERGHQVSCMRDVYSEAQRVVVWLARQLSPVQKWEDYTQTRADRQINEEDCDETGPMSALFDNEYWSRVWIVQEVVLARHLVLFFEDTGGSPGILDLDAFIRLNYDPDTAVGLPHDDWRLDPENLNWGNALEIVKTRNEWSSVPRSESHDLEIVPRPVLTLPEIIRFASVQQCTFNADKVYGFLGLQDSTRFPISVDYSKSNEDIYAEVIPRLVDFVYTFPWRSRRAVEVDFEKGCQELARALGIHNDRECGYVIRLMLQLRGIPLSDTYWEFPPYYGQPVFEKFSKSYQELAYKLPADKGISPFLKYLHMDPQFGRELADQSSLDKSTTLTIGDIFRPVSYEDSSSLLHFYFYLH